MFLSLAAVNFWTMKHQPKVSHFALQHCYLISKHTKRVSSVLLQAHVSKLLQNPDSSVLSVFQESKPAEGGDSGSEYIKLKVVGQVSHRGTRTRPGHMNLCVWYVSSLTCHGPGQDVAGSKLT